MSMRFHQKRFFAYPSGAPNLHTLNTVSSNSYVLVTTDRSVSILNYGDAGYNLRKLEVDALHTGKAAVVASAVIERPESRQSQVAVVYTVGDTLFLQVVTPLHNTQERLEASNSPRFELETAPTNLFSVKAAGSGGDVFYGVMACCVGSMLAFGFIENEKNAVKEDVAVGNNQQTVLPCVRLNNEQFTAFFPEFATFSRPILAVDIFRTPTDDQGWITFGLIRVFHGQVYEGCLGGPYKTKDLQLSGPVTSVALFPKRLNATEEEVSSWHCNLLVSCAIGQGVVYEDLFSTTNDVSSEVLVDSDSFDSIFAGITADIDLDGEVELLLGTDSQVLLAYKEEQNDNEESGVTSQDTSTELVEPPGELTPASGNASPVSTESSLNIWRDTESASASPPGLKTLSTLDDISNAICSVIDAAELCRNVHPDEQFRRAASECFTDLSDFIQNLNADVELYRTLKTVTESADGMANFSPEQKRMGILLRNEFERDGIHLSRTDRQRVIALQNDITQLSMKFQSTMYSAREYVEVPAKLIRGLPHSVTSVCERKWMSRDMMRVPTDQHVASTILKWVGDPEVRRNMYIAANSCAKDNLPVLDELRAKRHELAQLLGFPTYAHLATSDRMIGSPEAVEGFIEDIAKQLMIKAKMEQQHLLDAKRRHEGRSCSKMYMWDLPYYMGMLKAQKHRIDSRVISSYFPLENCLKGLHLLCSKLFGLELKQVPMTNASERWHEDVHKLALIRNGETLGYIYFDLYPRANKYNHAAHFTIRCGKRLSETSYQKPIVALVCNFNKPAPDSPSLLTHAEVETLFHEFGHAMHSLLSRTEFQHLSGTRAALDFVETPSHLFEYFAWDYRVVQEFSSHYKTGHPLPAAMMQGLRSSKTMFAAMDTQTQCLYSILDLQLFGEQPLPCTPPTTTQMLHELQNSSTLVPHVDGTFWHTRFGHLIGYGAGYYSYLYARVFAADIWHSCFGRQGPLNRDAGEQLYQKLMVHGGAKDPNELLVDILGRSPSPTNYLHELGV
ncbi:hypothetical protein BBO99_00005333 [Phytophthora kernoviae]|uniref:Peptidase M3A/M3B catalytic domain-containing protein n=2 Tax=Phytophthora kernoviae TaxID=325452 RepID=A0A3R7NFM6_9STRA|nr:hypothetical protein G195_009343 [Phytophthora kernoviae 00238/432]KAG2522833.1 hypothetical protein JM16_003266 [Phytophthora kernoviae]KAG2524448.1 hypothetical protein JM18_002969 [Phytophthora kernoviae]RLN21634.1 hypothetical protein BBI17_003597 [Phytophthora kernoviae]RLN79333.1 hypothetical protein BBO99_00005333 [Phytophthora kernoviae]